MKQWFPGTVWTLLAPDQGTTTRCITLTGPNLCRWSASAQDFLCTGRSGIYGISPHLSIYAGPDVFLGVARRGTTERANRGS
jgi:hypothetical protein